MKTRYSVTLDRNSLEAVAPEIIIIDIACTQQGFVRQTGTLQNRNGQFVYGQKVIQTTVSVLFEIHTKDVKRRQKICMDVQKWAMCGTQLRTGSRPGLVLNVRCSEVPVITSELKWTGRMTVAFTADERPFWEEEYEQRAEVSGGGVKGVYVQGSVERVPVDVDIVNSGTDSVDTLTVSAGETHFTLENIGLAAGEMLRIGHDERGFLTIKKGVESMMHARTAGSSDELMLMVNKHEKVRLTGSSDAKAVFKFRGAWI